MRIWICIFILVITGCDGDNSPSNNEQQDERNIAISTKDQDGNTYLLSSIEWWYASDPTQVFQLACDDEKCDTWVLPEDISGPIYIRASDSVEWENDPQCWDMYNGEEYIDADPNVFQNVDLILYSNSAVCA